MSEMIYRKQAIEAKPSGYFLLNPFDKLRPDDLVWSVFTKEFLRADSPEWTNKTPLEDPTDTVCAIRRAGWTDFEKSIPTQRKFTLKKFEPAIVESGAGAERII